MRLIKSHTHLAIILIKNYQFILFGHSAIIDLNRYAFNATARIMTIAIEMALSKSRNSIPLNPRTNEIRLFMKWAKIGTRIFSDFI